MTSPDRTQRPGARRYEGTGITVSFEARRCLHAAECVRNLPEVFDTSRAPWIQPGGTPADRLAEVVRRCPSGALQYHRTDGVPDEQPVAPTRVTPGTGGVLFLRGDLAIDTPDGVRGETRAALCGCHGTGRPPYCDRSGPCHQG